MSQPLLHRVMHLPFVLPRGYPSAELAMLVYRSVKYLCVSRRGGALQVHINHTLGPYLDGISNAARR